MSLAFGSTNNTYLDNSGHPIGVSWKWNIKEYFILIGFWPTADNYQCLQVWRNFRAEVDMAVSTKGGIEMIQTVEHEY
jgi:hypothetical protein